MFINILKTLHMANLALVYKRSKKKKEEETNKKTPKHIGTTHYAVINVLEKKNREKKKHISEGH